MSFTTDHRVPNLLLEYSAAVLEKQIDSDVPVYVANMKRLDWVYDRVDADGVSKSQKFGTDVPEGAGYPVRDSARRPFDARQ